MNDHDNEAKKPEADAEAADSAVEVTSAEAVDAQQGATADAVGADDVAPRAGEPESDAQSVVSGHEAAAVAIDDTQSVGDVAEVKSILEAALLIAGEPTSTLVLSRLFDPPLSQSLVNTLLADVARNWQGRKVELVQVASGWRFQGTRAVQPYLDRLSPEKPPRYSRAVMETLAIIAYQQPVTRGDIEAIRGVAVSTNVVKSLEDRQWVEVVGHRETPGRPALYATTKLFLDDLGLRSLAELPPLAELDTSNLLEMPDAPAKAAEAAMVLATPLLGPEPGEADEHGAARDPGEHAPDPDQTLH